MNRIKYFFAGLILFGAAFVLSCTQNRNTLDNTVWESYNSSDNTVSQCQFQGNNGGTLTIKQMPQDSMLSSLPIGYTYNEITGAVTIQNKNNAYRGSISNGVMTVVWDLFSPQLVGDTIVFKKIP